MGYDNYQIWKNQKVKGEVYLSIVVPAYNEAQRIVPTLGAIAATVSDLFLNWELIVADDGSRDDTAKLVEELQFSNLRLLRSAHNEGKGSAVQRGVLAAQGRYILMTDADNSTPIEELEKFLQKMVSEDCDVVVGTRFNFNGGRNFHHSAFRQFLSESLKTIVRNFFQIKVSDTQCGFKLFTARAGKQLHMVQTIKGFSFDVEVLYLASRHGFSVKELPVNWADAPGSKMDAGKEPLRFLRDLLKIKFNDWKGRYKSLSNSIVLPSSEIVSGETSNFSQLIN